jgi:hypothetical protein
MVGNTESGKSDPVKLPDCRCQIRHPMRQVLAPNDDRIGCRALLPSLRRRSKERCLYPSDSFVPHVWKHVSIRIHRKAVLACPSCSEKTSAIHRQPASVRVGKPSAHHQTVRLPVHLACLKGSAREKCKTSNTEQAENRCDAARRLSRPSRYK